VHHLFLAALRAERSFFERYRPEAGSMRRGSRGDADPQETMVEPVLKNPRD
jgi:hypothetical protein